VNFLTYEDIDIAKANGIDYLNAYNRVHKLNWPVEKAITTPLKRKEDQLWPKYRELAAKHDIKHWCFFQRLKRGMSPEQAATMPKVPYGERARPCKITKEFYEIAAQNGIKRSTVNARVYNYKWPVEKAVSEPVDEKKRGRAKEKSATV
jgi:hypothetical protein